MSSTKSCERKKPQRLHRQRQDLNCAGFAKRISKLKIVRPIARVGTTFVQPITLAESYWTMSSMQSQTRRSGGSNSSKNGRTADRPYKRSTRFFLLSVMKKATSRNNRAVTKPHDGCVIPSFSTRRRL